MKYLFDQNISHRILSMLPAAYQYSSSVKKEKLIDYSDYQIWDFARENEFIIVTQDADFNDLAMLNGFPPKVIWIRVGNLKTIQIYHLLIRHEAAIQDFIQDPNYACFEIIHP